MGRAQGAWPQLQLEFVAAGVGLTSRHAEGWQGCRLRGSDGQVTVEMDGGHCDAVACYGSICSGCSRSGGWQHGRHVLQGICSCWRR